MGAAAGVAVHDPEITRLRQEVETLKAQQQPVAQPKSLAGKSELTKAADTMKVDEWDTKQLTITPIDHQAWLEFVAPGKTTKDAAMAEEMSLEAWVKEEQDAWAVRDLRKLSDEHLGGMKAHGRNQKMILLHLLAAAVKSKEGS